MAREREVVAQEVLIGLSMIQAELNQDAEMLKTFNDTYSLEEQRDALLTALGAALGALHGSTDMFKSRDAIIEHMRNVAFQMMG